MKEFYNKINKLAEKHVEEFKSCKSVSRKMLETLRFLYENIGSEKDFDDSSFESAYQLSVTPLFEFYLARFLYHYSKGKNLGWKIYLRRQKDLCVPDIRIDKNKKPIAVIEVKSKAGWIQPFFSEERYKKDMKKVKSGESKFDPNDLIKKQLAQLEKYNKIPDNPKVYMLLPTFAMIHRKKSEAKVEDYKKWFAKKTQRKYSLIVMSDDLSLDLARKDKKDIIATNEFEKMIKDISKL